MTASQRIDVVLAVMQSAANLDCLNVVTIEYIGFGRKEITNEQTPDLTRRSIIMSTECQFYAHMQKHLFNFKKIYLRNGPWRPIRL
jgi:hypothetical protein